MKNHPPADSAPTYSLKESPFVETDGLLMYKDECKTPRFLNSSLLIPLFGEAVIVDHYVLLFSNSQTLKNYGDALVKYNAKITEGPGIFPVDFCNQENLLPEDLWMYFLSALMPSGVILVLAAPHALNDKIDRLLNKYGDNILHHIAIRVNDVQATADAWRNKGFIPLSMTPQDDGSLCQWFLSNWAGQIVELIHRPLKGSKETFSCQNIVSLRLSELEASGAN